MVRKDRVTPTASGDGRVPDAVSEVLRSPGQPLDVATRAEMEARFGHHFGRVQVHTGAKASESARAIDAEAYSFGTSVVFGSGRYAPHTSAGRSLLAHELAHVVQQDGNPVSSPTAIGEPDGAAEQQARRAASGVTVPAADRPGRAAPATVQRRTIWEEFGGLFRGDDIPEPELMAYLDLLDTGVIEDYTDSDNKARAVVRHWKRGDSRFLLTPERKILLIREMLSGFVGNPDEQAILDLLRGSSVDEFQQILSAIGKEALDNAFHWAEQDQLDALVAARRRPSASDEPPDREAEQAAATEVFPPEMVVDLQRRFTSNAESTNRLNCIAIIKDIAPQLYASDPSLAQRLQRRLRGVSTMTEFGRAMSDLGLASEYRRIRFNNGNGLRQPTEMESSAWDAIMEMVGDIPGWHVFGMAVFDGYHSVTVLVENRLDGPRVYWADQWRIDLHEDHLQEPGSVSGFRRYEQAGFDQFLSEFTEKRWRRVLREKGARYAATLHIWKFRSALSEASRP